MYLRNKNSYLSLANLMKLLLWLWFCVSYFRSHVFKSKTIKRFSFGKKFHFHANNFFIVTSSSSLKPCKPKHQHSDSHLLSLYFFHRGSGEILLKYQLDSSCVIMSLILVTNEFCKAFILQRESYLPTFFVISWQISNRSEAHLELNSLRRKNDCALIIKGDSLEVCLKWPSSE